MSTSRGARALATLANPILIKSARARLRLKHLLSWGTITVTVTAFVCLLVYLTATERGLTDEASAAKTMLLPIIIIQGVILMLLGTGAVASGLARERDERLLDYHRLTPMSPTGKILGFLFGLPVREYVLFALTLPFLAWAVMVSGIALSTVLHFYLVFFSSVWVYHLTGFVAGMISAKPRRAALMAQGMVVLLYLVLPQLSFVGLTFFEFLTIRPTLYLMIMTELEATRPGLEDIAAQTMRELERFEEVPLFDWVLHPTVYTLMVQGFLLVSMLVVVYRKWINEPSHPFSKIQALAFHAGTQFFLVGSLWSFIGQDRFLRQLRERIGGGGATSPIGASQILELMLFVFVLVSGAVCVFLVAVATPTRDTAVQALRRCRKLGRPFVGPNSDGASSLPLCLAMIGFSGIGCWLLIGLARDTGQFFEAMPSVWVSLAPLVLFAAVLLFFQAIVERLGARATFVILFLMWMLPFFTCLILYAAREEWVLGTYLALPFPPVAGAMSLGDFFLSAGPVDGQPVFAPPSLESHVSLMTRVAAVMYGGLALIMQFELRRWKRGVRTAALAGG